MGQGHLVGITAALRKRSSDQGVVALKLEGRVRKLVVVVVALFSSALGLVLTFSSLVRMGWMRHGAPASDLSFLHLDWVFHPALPYWHGHVVNFGFLVLGLVLLLGPVVFVGVRLVRGR